MKDSFKLFRVAGIDVSLHWSWFLIAYWQIALRANEYHAPVWKVIEYLTLFLIVLLHEFGHAFACRSVGGKANYITLWPLGGIAYAQPPPRPGALLWTIVAGPLVNVVLLPVSWLAYRFAIGQGWEPDVIRCLFNVMRINIALLVFNILPIYPLDGGQILQSLLWFVIGRSRSIMVASVLGMVGAAALGATVYLYSEKTDNSTNLVWLLVIMLFLVSQSWRGFKYAQAMAKWDKIPRHENLACPECLESPFIAGTRRCDVCGAQYDPFVSGMTCPQCHKHDGIVRCMFCGRVSEAGSWEKSRQR